MDRAELMTCRRKVQPEWPEHSGRLAADYGTGDGAACGDWAAGGRQDTGHGSVCTIRIAAGWELVGCVTADTEDALLAGLAQIADALGVAAAAGLPGDAY